MRGKGYTLKELYDSKIDEPSGLLGGRMLLPGTLNALAASDGAGKTWILSLLGAKIAQGAMFGPMATSQGTVLFVSEEMVDWEMKGRMRLLLGEEEAARASEFMNFRFKTGLDLSIPQERRDLAELVQYYRPSLVIVDCLRDIHSLSEIDNDGLGVWLRLLRDRIAVPFKCAILFSHHFRKSQDGSPEDDWIQGGNILRRVCSDILYLVKEQGKPGSGVFKVNKIRHGRPHPPLRYDITDCPPRVFVDFTGVQ